ncbi:restriction endonuclease-related protein [Nocardia gamkensis]|uniref:restriction endonuclease-related protein n=1 Tax=Nocardia gamkensis TaxID=352869 RepID=UPI001B350DD6|nr:hypothetical protein [Nocardia gamkensis]
MSSTVTEVDQRRRDQAITACCLAAAALGDPDLTPRRQGRALMSCLGVLASTYPVGQAPTMAQFRSGLSRPLRQLLPDGVDSIGVGDLVLLDGMGQFSDEARDLCVEHLVPSVALEEHWPWARVAMEQEERRIYEVLRRLPAKDYTRARELLVDEPSGDLRDLRRTWDAMWGRFEHYERIVEWAWCQIRGWWFACPTCRWPMRVVGAGAVVEVRCEAHARNGITYTCHTDGPTDRAPVLQPAGPHASEVKARPATPESRAVSRVIWRYVTLPGILECDLRDHARAAGAKVDMWPHKDRYDLRITLKRKVWRVDAKAWASPVALGEALRETEPAEPGLIIVIPDHQRSSRDLLAAMLRGTGYRVMTATDLKNDVDKSAGVQR